MDNIQLPANFYFVGKPGSGKTYLIKYLIYKYSSERRFNYGWVICPTKFNKSYDFMPDEYVFDFYSDNLLLKILDTQKRLQKPAFLILDDCIGTAQFNSKAFLRLITTSRHLKLSVYIASQYAVAINPTVRDCIQNVCIFRQIQDRSFKCLFENFGVLYRNLKEFKKALTEMTPGKGIFMFFRTDKESKEEAYKSLKAPEIPDFELNF